jgi:hypothetical protein
VVRLCDALLESPAVGLLGLCIFELPAVGLPGFSKQLPGRDRGRIFAGKVERTRGKCREQERKICGETLQFR